MFENLKINLNEDFNILKKLDKLHAKLSTLLTIENYYRFPKEGVKLLETKEFKIFEIVEDLVTQEFILYKGEILIYFAPDITPDNYIIDKTFDTIKKLNLPESTIFSILYNDRGGKEQNDIFATSIDKNYKIIVYDFHVVDIGGFREYKKFTEYNLIKFKQIL